MTQQSVKTAEVTEGKDTLVCVIGDLKERCNESKEERVEIGRPQGGQIRMLGSYRDRQFGLQQRVKRLRFAWWTVGRRLKSSCLTARTQARVVEACVESTALFDAGIRP